MNKTNASKWIELGSAMLQGKKIQRSNGKIWSDVENINTISYDPESYRIKPEPKKGWYRVALLRDSENFQTATHDSGDEDYFSMEDHAVEIGMEFVRWLTDRIEYTLPEGDA